MTQHSYLKKENSKDCLMKNASERVHLEQIDHFQQKIKRSEMFKTTPEEKLELAKRMINYPSKNGAPVPPNN